MKKYMYVGIVLIIAIIIGVIIFTNKPKDVTIDINQLAEDIMQNTKFEDEMNEADVDTAKILYGIENAVSQKVYISSGATADEVSIFEFANIEDAKSAVEKVNTRISEQKESFENYIPKEVSKLENALVIQRGKYIITCVANDENVQKLIDKYTK